MIALLLIAGCAQPSTVGGSWLEGFRFGWDLFNHRVSRLTAQVDDSSGSVAFVGGTSTTGVEPALPTGCDPYSCEEFPTVDTSTDALYYGRVSTSHAAFGVGQTTLVVGKDGGSSEILIDLPEPDDTLVAVLKGVALSTDQPLEDGESSCYDPSNGWLPRRIQVSLGIPVLDGARVKVPVHAAFEAGNTLESARECIDVSKDFAEVAFTVEALLVSTKESAFEQKISGGMTFAWDPATGTGLPPEQVPTDAVRLDDALTADGIVGWKDVDFSFHPTDPEDRGAYLRTLDVHVDLGVREAAGQATNYSPGTQLSGFEYAFAGTLAGVPVEGFVEHGSASVAGVAAALDADGGAVVTDVPLGD